MKTSLLWRVVAAWAATQAGKLCAQPAHPSGPELSVPFTAKIVAADLKIDGLSAQVVGDSARFIVRYTSARERYLSLFNPPSGSVLKVLERGAVQPGTGRATIVAPLEKLRRAPALTLRVGISGDEADRNFVTLNITDPALRPIFGDSNSRPQRATDSRGTLGGVVKEVAARDDIRWKDASGVTGLDADKIASLTFNEATRWSPKDAEISRALLERARDPGLGVKSLHRAGITGAGVSVGIIDQNLFPDHPEFGARIARYHDVGCNASRGSMHGPAVASLLAGRTIGTAPGASLYYVAAPSWTKDAKYEADALHWLLDLNATLPAEKKIRVISVSAAPSGEGSPFTRNNALWDEACARAGKEHVLVLDCTAHRGIIGMCRLDPAARDDVTRVNTGDPRRNPQLRAKRILTPLAPRTVAEEYDQGVCSYQYDGSGGLSWAIPYAAGVLAMGWEVNPTLSPARMVELLRSTAHEMNASRVINPVAFIEAVKKTR